MKTIFSSIISLSVLPLMAFAQPAVPATEGFCNRLMGLRSQIEQRVISNESLVYQKRAEVLEKLENLRQQRDVQKTNNRLRWDTIYEEHTARLKAKAATEAHRAAVEKYVAAIVEAVNTRRVSTNAVMQTFRQGVDQAILARKATVNAAITNFKNAIASAFNKAETDCQNNVSPAAAHNNFVAALKAAREKFSSERDAAEKLVQNLQPLIASRKTAMEEIQTNFKTALASARSEFKAAFPGGE